MQEGRLGIAGIAGEETTAILRWHTRYANKQHVIGLIGLQLYPSTHSTSHTAPLPLFRPLRVKNTPFITRMHSQTDSTKRMMPKRLPIRNSFPQFSPSLEDPGIFPSSGAVIYY